MFLLTPIPSAIPSTVKFSKSSSSEGIACKYSFISSMICGVGFGSFSFILLHRLFWVGSLFVLLPVWRDIRLYCQQLFELFSMRFPKDDLYRNQARLDQVLPPELVDTQNSRSLHLLLLGLLIFPLFLSYVINSRTLVVRVTLKLTYEVAVVTASFRRLPQSIALWQLYFVV